MIKEFCLIHNATSELFLGKWGCDDLFPKQVMQISVRSSK